MGQHARPETKRPSKTLPTPRLKSGVLRVPRHDGVYIGLRDRGITITGLGAAAVTELCDGQHSRLDIALQTGVPRQRIDQILNLLTIEGLLDRDYQEPGYTPAIAERMQPELNSIAFRDQVDDGGLQLFLNRHESIVDIYGLDRVGVTIATLLSASGVGALRVHDERKVSPVDVAGTYRLGDVGQPREVVCAALIRDSAPLEIKGAVGATSLNILCGFPTPEDLLHLSVEGQPYLLVHSDPASATIGPLVIPSKSACARCVSLHRADHHEQWGSVELARLLENQRYVPSAEIASLAASLATSQILQFLDTQSAPTIGATMLIRDNQIEWQQWSKHPLCGCSWGYHHS